ncbi:MAG TPA: sulfatase [Planctomycetota bacterium]
MRTHRTARARAAGITLLGAAALAVLPVACGGSGGARRNVLLISIDSLRQDRLGIAGHRPEFAPEIAVSPNLDLLGAEGAVFDAAWSPTSWTLPAHVSLLTGVSPRLHGVETDEFALHPDRPTLAQVFQAAGYATAGVYSGPFLDPRYGFGRGFDRYESAMASPESKTEQIRAFELQRIAAGGSPLDDAEKRILVGQFAHWDITSPRVNELALAFLRGQTPGTPFFLFLHYFDVHYDYIPDRAEAGLGERFDPGYRGPFNGDNWYKDERVRDVMSGERRIGERDLRHVMALYDAEIHWVDRHVGAVLGALEELGLADETLVCVTADHGDEFFEHGGIGHRSTLFSELTHVPLLLRVPGETPPGLRVRTSVGLVDVAPTLLDYAGVAGFGVPVEGLSLRELVENDRGSDRPVLQRLIAHEPARHHLNIRDGWRRGDRAVLRRFEIDPQASSADSLRVRQERAVDGTPRHFVFVTGRRERERVALAAEDPRRSAALGDFCGDFRCAEQRRAAWAGTTPVALPPPGEDDMQALAALGYAMAGPAAASPLRFLAPLPEPCLP